MKKILIIFVLIIGMISGSVMAQNATSSATATPSAATEKDVKDLKEKLATKITELRKNGQKAISGRVTDNDGKIIKMKTDDEMIYDVKIDPALTKFYVVAGSGKKEITSDAVKKDTYSIVTGPVIDKTISANFIYQDEQFLVKSGKISEVNKSEFFIKILSTDKDTYTLDIESTTKQLALNIKTLEIERTGFSKMKEGDTVHFVVKKTGNEKEANRYSAHKILFIPQEYFIK